MMSAPTPVPPTASGPGSGPGSGSGSGQRTRILAVALELMSRHGSAGTSMRRLAQACNLNVATIYHYFPSKADLLQAVIAQRGYGDRLAGEMPPVDPALPARERFAAMFAWVWEQTEAENQILRLIVGEGLRGDETARASARSLIDAVDGWLSDVVAKTFPELYEHGLAPPEVARLMRRQLLGLVAENLASGRADGDQAARELADALFPAGQPSSLPVSRVKDVQDRSSPGRLTGRRDT